MINQEEALIQLIELTKSNGAFVSEKIEFKFHHESGMGVFANTKLEESETIFSIPFNLCLSVDIITSFDKIKCIFEDNPFILEYPDEVLALGLCYAFLTQDPDCPWTSHVMTMPKSFNTPLFWEEEELAYLQGHNIFYLVNMMKKRLASDYESIYLPLSQNYPELLGGIDSDIYAWAISIVYSRALDITRKDTATRVIVPVLDMVNHNPTVAEHATKTFHFEEESDVIQFKAATELLSGNECYAVYGSYPNAKLLYNYGFVYHGNPVKGIDLWTRIVPSNFNYEVKLNLLNSNPLTQNQTYDFQGTIRSNFVSSALLATIRVIQADENDMLTIQNAFKGKMVSVRNELATYVSLRNLILARLKPELAEVIKKIIFTTIERIY